MAALTEIFDQVMASPFSLVSIGLVVLAIALVVLVIWVVSIDKRTRVVVDDLEVERRKVAEMQRIMGRRNTADRQGASAASRSPQGSAGTPGAKAQVRDASRVAQPGQNAARVAQQSPQAARTGRVAQQPAQQQERRVPRQVTKAQAQVQANQPQVQAQTARSRSQQAPAGQRVVAGAAAGAANRVQSQGVAGKTAGRSSQPRSNSGYVSIPRGDAAAQAQASARVREQQARVQARANQGAVSGRAAGGSGAVHGNAAAHGSAGGSGNAAAAGNVGGSGRAAAAGSANGVTRGRHAR